MQHSSPSTENLPYVVLRGVNGTPTYKRCIPPELLGASGCTPITVRLATPTSKQSSTLGPTLQKMTTAAAVSAWCCAWQGCGVTLVGVSSWVALDPLNPYQSEQRQ